MGNKSEEGAKGVIAPATGQVLLGKGLYCVLFLLSTASALDECVHLRPQDLFY